MSWYICTYCRPSDEGDAIGSFLRPGTIVSVIRVDETNEWLHVNLDGVKAWLKRQVRS